MLLEQWRKVTLCKDTECHSQNPLYRTDSVYTWLNNDWTLKRNVTDLLSQQFFWLKMLQNVCTFCWNCDKCHINNSWKDRWQGFLKPLPVLKNLTKIFIDFVVDLSSSEDCTNLLIITDCLSKRIILKLCKNMTAEWWLRHSYNVFIELISFFHNSLRLRNSVCEQSVKRICQLLKIVWRMFTLITQKLMRWQNVWIRMLNFTFVCSLTTVKTTEQICSHDWAHYK
jgi:hypothetical protein